MNWPLSIISTFLSRKRHLLVLTANAHICLYVLYNLFEVTGGWHERVSLPATSAHNKPVSQSLSFLQSSPCFCPNSKTQWPISKIYRQLCTFDYCPKAVQWKHKKWELPPSTFTQMKDGQHWSLAVHLLS